VVASKVFSPYPEGVLTKKEMKQALTRAIFGAHG
jgi:hypothetical protein